MSIDNKQLTRNIKKWCEKAPEAAYTRNINSTIKQIQMTQYTAVYGIKSCREIYISQNSGADQEAHHKTHPDLRVDDLKECENEEE